MSDTQNEPLPGEKAIKLKKAGPILLGADRYDIFEKGQKAIREFVEELFRFLIDFPGMMYLVFILTIIVAGENRDKELMLEELAVLMNTSQYTVEIQATATRSGTSTAKATSIRPAKVSSPVGRGR